MTKSQPMPGMFARLYWILFCMGGLGKTVYVSALSEVYRWIDIDYGNTHLFYWAKDQGYLSIREISRKEIGLTPLMYPKDILVRTKVDDEGNLKFRGKLIIMNFVDYIQLWMNRKYRGSKSEKRSD